MTGLVNLHVLRRIAECDCATMATIGEDCARITTLKGRVLLMQAEGLLVIRQEAGVEYLTVTGDGLAALDAEPTHMRDKPMFTNR